MLITRLIINIIKNSNNRNLYYNSAFKEKNKNEHDLKIALYMGWKNRNRMICQII